MSEKLLSTEDVVRNLQNVQIYPTTHRVEINDKFTKVIFSTDLNPAGNHGIIEKKNFKPKKGKAKKIITQYTVSNPDLDVIDLSEFDRAVLSVCISEQKAGNLYTTVNIIFRSLVGKVTEGDDGVRPQKNQREAIVQALKNLMGTIVNFKNARENLIEMGYLDANEPFDLAESSILPAARLDCKINGQPVEDVVYFDRTSPLLEIAEKKNQIVRFETELLDVPDQNNTPLIIALKTYVLRRVAEIKLHKQFTPTITFADVFEKCRVDNVSRDQKFNCRSEILKLFQHLKDTEFISDFNVLKHGVSVYGVSFTK